MTAQINITDVLKPFMTNWPVFVALIVILVVAKILGSAGFKGWFGEKVISRGLARLDSADYSTFHDFYYSATARLEPVDQGRGAIRPGRFGKGSDAVP